MARNRLFSDAQWVALFAFAAGIWLVQLLSQSPLDGLTLLAVLAGVFVADAGSYIFHYIVDHYGNPERPGLVREFQQHHKNPRGIVQKPLAEVLAPAARIITPVFFALAMPLFWGWIPSYLAWLMWAVGTCWLLAQLFHRWSHSRAPWLVRQAQRSHLLLSPHQHRLHHLAPFETRFAVITGWSNFPFDKLRVTQGLDWLLQLLGFEKRGLVHNLTVLKEKNS